MKLFHLLENNTQHKRIDNIKNHYLWTYHCLKVKVYMYMLEISNISI